jgi:hypothetical protein
MNGEPSNARKEAGSSIGADAKKRKRRLKEWAIHEGKLFFAIFLYLFILFGLINLHEYVILARHNIDFTKYGYGLINAWIFARILLVAEHLHLEKGFGERPLIYPVLLKASLFMIVVIVVRALEAVLVGLWNGKTILESIPVMGGGGLEGIASVALIVAFAMIPYFAYTEVARVMGKDELRALILRRRRNTKILPPTAPE